MSLATMAFAGALLLGWGVWFGVAKISLVESSETARLETTGSAHPIQAVVTGTIAASSLVLDREVNAGDVLVEIDSRAEQLSLQEAKEKFAADGRQLEFLRQELAASETAQSDDRHASRAALARSRALTRDAAARSELALEESRRLNALKENGHLGEMEAMRAATEAVSRQSAAEASADDAARMVWDTRKQVSEWRAVIERLYREIAVAEGERTQLGTQIERLEHEIERRKVRSPVAGRIGEIAALPEGAVVQVGAALGTVVPPGELHVVAEFQAATAIGRVTPGERAQVSLAGFPWVEYGVLRATVTRVGNEPRDGRIRAELALDPDRPPAIPLQHGLAGLAEVEVEQVTPARLVLRAVGAALRGGRSPSEPPAPRPRSTILAGASL